MRAATANALQPQTAWLRATLISPRGRVLLTVALLGLACLDSPESPDLPDSSSFHIGSTRAEVLDSFGPPSRKQSYTKTNEPIWGAIENFWDRAPTGSTVEVWAYAAEGGTAELYFVDGSERVQGLGFEPYGVVYEAEP